MRTTELWLEEKVSAYKENQAEALIGMLSTTTNVIEQFINNPESIAAKEVLESCLKHNKLFIEKIDTSNVSSENDINSVVETNCVEKWNIIQWQDNVIKSVDKNHIWLNAFSCVNPSKDFCEQLGKRIIEMLNDKDNLLPDDGITSENENIRALSNLSKQLYLSINKS